jgi:hypothetical protein
MSDMRNKLRVTLLISASLAAMSAMALLVIGIFHNAQGEFYSADERFDFAYALFLFSSWFFLIFILSILVGLIGFLLVFVVNIIREKLRA